jgi:hypothetical protein
MLATSRKTLAGIKDDVNAMRTMWEFEQTRIETTEKHQMC